MEIALLIRLKALEGFALLISDGITQVIRISVKEKFFMMVFFLIMKLVQTPTVAADQHL